MVALCEQRALPVLLRPREASAAQLELRRNGNNSETTHRGTHAYFGTGDMEGGFILVCFSV